MASKVIEVDKGLNKIFRLFEKASKKTGPSIEVGILTPKASAPHDSKSGLSNAELGAIHEFGKGNVPERSFLRATVDSNREKYMRFFNKAAKKSIDKKTTFAVELDVLAKRVKNDVVKRIKAGINPPLTARTLAKKKSGNTTPLIDTKTLIKSITSRVVKK